LKRQLLLLLACALGLVVPSCSRTDSTQGHKQAEPSAQVGGAAPDFTLKDITGADRSLTSFKGSVVLLEFWATWCPPCKAAVPELVELHRKYHERGFTVIGVSVDSGSDVASVLSRFSASEQINYPLLIADEAVPRTYNVTSIPVGFLIDRNGTIVETYMGYSYDFGKNVSSRIEALL
jgi:peroxiredoxin